ncbi:MAG: gfo/Idh/MocA family oxidoreductase [Acidobacteria bacterium]|nr:MAG: gfo/Idh/MocA family oxidoreductase [Acidobacteriota bacterium]PYY23225.1 MAG: gfo/Idh/MocA family oxidoreductase [Acidobacteriota bacterium]
MNRREFLGGAAAVAASTLVQPSSATMMAASDRVNLAIIGPGSRGQQLMRTFLRVPGVRFAALCDIYEPRWDQARKITGENTRAFNDYRELLSTKDIDAVIVSTPLSLHSEHVIAALDSGHHVYGEKSMALTVPQCGEMRDAVKKSGRHYQIGLQYHYAPWYREAMRLIMSGKIGQVTQIYAYWHRNNSWRRPVPNDDPKLERLINWRLYREFSGGLVAELGSHHINFANEVFGGIPESVVGSGGVDFWKDGRETADNVQVIYRYPDGKTLFFSAITTNHFDGCQVQVCGTGGSIVLTEADGTYYYEPKTSSSAVPEALAVEHGVVTGASYKAELPYRGQGRPLTVPAGTQGNPDFVACDSFIESIRSNQRPKANEDVAWNCGVTVALGNYAIDHETGIKFADHVRA